VNNGKPMTKTTRRGTLNFVAGAREVAKEIRGKAQLPAGGSEVGLLGKKLKKHRYGIEMEEESSRKTGGTGSETSD